MKTSILKQPHSLSITAVTLAVMLALPAAHAATLNAQLDRSSISVGDTVTFSINLPANRDKQPDLSPLRQDFDILGTGSSTQVQIINGQSSQSNQLNITLAPHGKGNITIPAIKVGSDETPPLKLTVKDVPVADSSKAGQPVWVEMETSLPEGKHTVTVQQEIPVTVRLYASVPLSNVSLNPPAPAGATVEKLTQDKQYQTERNGQTYQVLEQHYVIFPEQAGEMNIPPVTLRAMTPDPNQQQRGPIGGSPFNDDFFKDAFKGSPMAQQMMNDGFFSDPFSMFDSGKQVSLRSNDLQFTVGHIPAAAQGKTWLPARQVSLTDSWQDNPPPLRSGEPVSLTLTVTADGLTGEHIPAITLPKILGVRVYNEPVQAESHTNGEQVTGTSTQTFTLIPEQTGELKLPAISLPWWNTQTQSQQTAELPARTLKVAQGSGTSAANMPAPTATQAAPATPAQTQQTNSAAMSANTSWLDNPSGKVGGSLLTLLLLAGGWYAYRRKQQADSNPQQSSATWTEAELHPRQPQPTAVSRAELEAARTHFLQVCSTNEPHLTAKALLEWAKLVWLKNPPVSLHELASRAEAKTEIFKLHQRLYQYSDDDESWSGEALAKALQDGLKAKTSLQKDTDKPGDKGLPPLYPA